MLKHAAAAMICGALGLLMASVVGAAEDSGEILRFTARARVAEEAGEPRVVERAAEWPAAETAVIVCDVWDRHWCASATRRVEAMTPRLEAILGELRRRGVLVIHAPSDTMEFYEETPQRQRAVQAPAAADAPAEIDRWCARLPGEPPLPIDDSDGGCDCQPQCETHRAWSRQHPAITIAEADAVSDSGREIWNLLEARGIENVILVGVHTNMCVAGRPFGMRRLVEGGKNVVLVRDLTDAMYNPRRAPFVDHDRGTELVVAHLEEHVAPSVLADDLVGEPPAAHIVFVVGEDEYDTEETLPEFFRAEFEPAGFRATYVFEDADDQNDFHGMEEALAGADLVFLSVRRRVPREPQLAALRAYLEAGRPLVAIRTSSHAFDIRQPPPEGRAEWPLFDREVLGGHYQGHYGVRGEGATQLEILPEAETHPIVAGIDPPRFASWWHLYRNRDLAESTTVLVEGWLDGQRDETTEPVSWTNIYRGGRIFYTSLGSPDDFDVPQFRHKLRAAVYWALERQIPAAP